MQSTARALRGASLLVFLLLAIGVCTLVALTNGRMEWLECTERDGLYYEFSTIAQTLGGAFALLAAFALYRVQLIDASLAAYFLKFRRAFRPVAGREFGGGRRGEVTEIEKYAIAIAYRDYSEALRLYDARVARLDEPPNFFPLAPRYRYFRTMVESDLALKAGIGQKLKRAALITASSMTVSLIVIAFAHSQSLRCSPSGWVIVISGWAIFLFTLWTYWAVIDISLFRRMLKDRSTRGED